MFRVLLLTGMAIGLCGCGAETAAVATLGYIAPIGGDFTLDTDPATPQLERGNAALLLQRQTAEPSCVAG